MIPLGLGLKWRTRWRIGGTPFDDPQTAGHPQPAADVPARRVGAQEDRRRRRTGPGRGRACDRPGTRRAGSCRLNRRPSRAGRTWRAWLINWACCASTGSVVELGDQMRRVAVLFWQRTEGWPWKFTASFPRIGLTTMNWSQCGVGDGFLERADEARSSFDRCRRVRRAGRDGAGRRAGPGRCLRRRRTSGGLRPNTLAMSVGLPFGPVDRAAAEVELWRPADRIGEIDGGSDFAIRDGAMSHGFVAASAEELESRRRRSGDGAGRWRPGQASGGCRRVTGHGAEPFERSFG